MSAQADRATPDGPLLNGAGHQPRRQVGQSGYGSVDGSVVHGDENAQPADHATPEGEEGGPSALGTPAHVLGPSVQTREDSMSQETSQDPVSLPDGVLPARTMGNAADFLGMVQMRFSR